jgi:hypothetical protein
MRKCIRGRDTPKRGDGYFESPLWRGDIRFSGAVAGTRHGPTGYRKCEHRRRGSLTSSVCRQARLAVVDSSEHYGHVIVRANIDGTFDKRGLPDPLQLDFYFSARDDKIVQLIICATSPARDETGGSLKSARR